MATDRSSHGTIYSPLPQSMSDADSTEEEEEEEELNNIGVGQKSGGHPQKTPHAHSSKGIVEGRNGRGRANRGMYQPLGGSDHTLNGIPSQIGLKSKSENLHESDLDSSQPPPLVLPTPEILVMSTSRKACFFFSIILCFLVVIGFLFVLPCDLPTCVPTNERNSTLLSTDSSFGTTSTSTLRSMGGSWERVLPGIELKGKAHLVSSSLGPGLNMVFLVRGQLPGLSSTSALSPPPAMSLVSSSFLSESSKCSFAPAVDIRNMSSLNDYDQSTLGTYCNTELEVAPNDLDIQQSLMSTSLFGPEDSSQSPKADKSSSHYRSKRILDNPPTTLSAGKSKSLEQSDEFGGSKKVAQVKSDGEQTLRGSDESTVKQLLSTGGRGQAGVMLEPKPKQKRSSAVGEKRKGDDSNSVFLNALAGGGGGLVSLSGTTGQPMWQASLPSPAEELDCGLLDTDADGISDCLAFAGRSGLLAAVNPTTGAVIWYLHDHKSQMRPTALQFPVSIPDLDGDGTKDLAIACTLPTSHAQPNNQSASSNRASSTSPNSSSYSPQTASIKGSSFKSSSSSKKEFSYSSSQFLGESPVYQSARPLPSPSSSPDTVSLAVASGRSGSIIGHPLTPVGCVTVSSITLNMQTLGLSYRCVTVEGDEISKSLSVDDLYGEKKQNASSSPESILSTPTPLVDVELEDSSAQDQSLPSTPLAASSVLSASHSFSSSPASHSQRHSTSSSAWVSGHQLLVENHGHCHTILLSPSSTNFSFQSPPCSVSVRLTDSRNSTLWAHEGVLAHAMDPVPLLFRQPNRGLWPEDSPSSSQGSGIGGEHPVSGFVLKFWQWSMPKLEHNPMGREDKGRDINNDKTPGGPNSLFRTRLKRRNTADLILPPLAAAASSSLSPSASDIQNHSSQAKRQSPIGNTPRHGGLFPNGSGKKKLKGNSYKGLLAPIVNQLKERVVLITFNDTGLHVINASQSDVTQLCERIRSFGGSGKKRGKGGNRAKDKGNQESGFQDQKLKCQPELVFQEQSLLVADLDKDGYQELVSYLTTYVNSRRDESDTKRRTNQPKWFLESRVKVVLLEAELPKLYEAVATPGS